jgi:signal transduction histidine kinase
VVGLLRDPEDAVGGTSPGPEDLAELVRAFERRGHGAAVRLELPEREAASWPPEVAGTVYRVVQESLTNISRHAPHARSARVTVLAGGGASDDGSDRGSDLGSGLGSDRGSDRGSGLGSDRGSDRGSGLGSDRGSDRGSGLGSDRGSDGGSDRGSGYGPARSSEPRTVTVEIVDDAPAAGGPRHPHREGYGLLGMRERVEALGGSLDAGPGSAGGWAVRARLPLPAGGPR